MLILLKNGNVYAPEFLGRKDILLAGKEILAIEDKIDLKSNEVNIEVINCIDKNVYPGFIDGHVHITGGGGEGSFRTRTPEIKLSEITTAGVTTVVGCLGTDGTTRSMTNLLAKAYALEEEGISTFVYSGSYHVPVRTLTGDIQDDIVLVEKIIGVGEIAVSDHRSSVPTVEELMKIASSARVGGMLSNKAGIINIHMGDGKSNMDKLYEIREKSEIPFTQFLPTHMNRNKELFEEGIDYAKNGGYLDFTTSTIDKFIEEGEVSCPKALRRIIDEKISVDQVTFTSDGQGSLPIFDKNNNLIGLKVGSLQSLYQAVIDSVKKENIPLEIALKVITENPARILKLSKKGNLVVGNDGDIVIADSKDLSIETVIAKGVIMVKNKEVLVKGTFE
ncbi:MAG: beta-aspartyl-peptidase [Clostridiales bacterium]|nr:beta-aspartyl-peptidase [Clostridiales bacterium]